MLSAVNLFTGRRAPKRDEPAVDRASASQLRDTQCTPIGAPCVRRSITNGAGRLIRQETATGVEKPDNS
jgi:hypothetical protein